MHFEKAWLLSCCFILLTHFSFSQTKNVVGQVFIFNSKSENGKIESAEDVKIYSPQCKPDYSDEAGRFKLKLNNVVPGTPVFFQIEKKGFEVVDHNNLQYHLIDEKTRLRVFLAKEGYLKKVRYSLMENAKKSINTEKERLIELLNFGGAARNTAFRIIEKRTGMKMDNASEAEKFILGCASALEEQLRLCAYELAIINPDFASETFLSALNHYQRNNLEGAIAAIASEDLEGDIEQMKIKVDKIKSHPSKVNQIINRKGRRFDQIKDSYLLHIIALQQSFRFKEAHSVLKKFAEANAIAPTHKHTELIERLNFFKFLEYTDLEEELVLETLGKQKPSMSNRFDEKKDSEIVENEIEPPSQSMVRESKLVQRKYKKPTQFQPVSNSDNRIIKHPNDVLKEQNIAVEYSSIPSSTSPQIEPIIVHQSNGNNETIITIKISNSTGKPSEHLDNMPKVIKNENTQPPRSYHLASKGTPAKMVMEAVPSDFETILFPIKNSASHFKNFVEKEIIHETTKKIHPHTKR